MSFLKKILGKDDHEFNVAPSEIVFHKEHTGAVEDRIKNLWKISLQKFADITEAYLVVADFGKENNPHPVLCLFPRPNNHIPIVNLLSENFKEIFGKDQFVDIIFLNQDLRVKCANVCKPFYLRVPGVIQKESLDDEKGLCKRCRHPFSPHIVIAYDAKDFSKGGEMRCPVKDCTCFNTISFNLNK